ncbi:hypothetical protein BO86DRAFT_457828 [Aspergillus japonicus CBS 114.51]|uniref:Uncharacterized protein n=2 Tax=Aspergillus TaxID=5052 RepID=A0A2V5GU19_ASPV1|nr:hypothetical protein BO86DRAFT_457828 [Aspergillus japonicus CBS 114.51]PYI14608.1 hypothetical protein BO99DRAFT_15546 [Aspergillus violaceofuscus CBS 115571]RAH79499.1 hypothetical protein BO86DRAFT_457828 [Aspergillus japonicus CBS 114.51]
MNPLPPIKRHFFGESSSEDEADGHCDPDEYQFKDYSSDEENGGNASDLASEYNPESLPPLDEGDTSWKEYDPDEGYWYVGTEFLDRASTPSPTQVEAQEKAAARRAARRRKKAEARAALEAHLERRRAEAPIEPLLAGLDEKLDRWEVTLALHRAITFLEEGQDREAEHFVLEAVGIAQRLGNPVCLARCQYWQGRVEYSRENYHEAQQCFQACREGILDAPEGETITWYLRVSRPGLTEEERQQIGESEQVRDRAQGLYGYSPQSTSPVSGDFHFPHLQDTEHAWGELEEGEPPGEAMPYEADDEREQIRESEQDRDRAQAFYGYSPENASLVSANFHFAQHTRKEEDRPRSEATPDETSNDNQRRILTPKSRLPFVAGEFDSDGLQLHRSQKHFTFEMYPQGMAPRTRPTNIFPEQRNEILMSEESWKAFNEYVQDKGVTMSYLDREGQKYREAIKKKNRAAWAAWAAEKRMNNTCVIM